MEDKKTRLGVSTFGRSPTINAHPPNLPILIDDLVIVTIIAELTNIRVAERTDC